LLKNTKPSQTEPREAAEAVLEIYLTTLLVESQDLSLREVLLEALSSVIIAPMHRYVHFICLLEFHLD
jgi:hypothetical protein